MGEGGGTKKSQAFESTESSINLHRWHQEKFWNRMLANSQITELHSRQTAQNSQPWKKKKEITSHFHSEVNTCVKRGSQSREQAPVSFDWIPIVATKWSAYLAVLHSKPQWFINPGTYK